MTAARRAAIFGAMATLCLAPPGWALPPQGGSAGSPSTAMPGDYLRARWPDAAYFLISGCDPGGGRSAVLAIAQGGSKGELLVFRVGRLRFTESIDIREGAPTDGTMWRAPGEPIMDPWAARLHIGPFRLVRRDDVTNETLRAIASDECKTRP